MGNSTKELVNAFNLNNYACNNIGANFTLEGKKIVGLFASNTNTKEYLRRIGDEIMKRHYGGGSEVAHKYYNLSYFPFVSSGKEKYIDENVKKVELADSINNEIIHNLKVHFASEFKRAVEVKVVARLEKSGLMKEEVYKWMKATVGTAAMGMPYLYCIGFSDEYLKRKYDSETFEMLKGIYIQEFNFRLGECGLESSDFYEYKDDMLYIKDVSDKVVKSVAEYVKGRVALDFRTPGSVESKVQNCKNVLSELILEATGKFVDGYDYADFTDEKEIKNGHSFVIIPFIEENGQFKSLSFRDASKINGVFNKEIPNVDDNFISDIRGKTANPQFANCTEPVYAFSNRQIALLLPMIMQSPIAYNEENKGFEFAVDLRSQQFVFPTPRLMPVPNRHLNSDEKPGPSRKLSLPKVVSPRRGEGLLFNHVNLAVASTSGRMSSIVVNPGISGPSSQSLSAAQNVSAAWSHDPWSPQSTSGSKWQSSPEPGPSVLSWKSANKSGSASTSAPSPWSFSVQPHVTQKPTFVCYKDSDYSRLPGLLTDERPTSRYSTESGYSGSPGPQQSTPSTEEYNERSASVYSADSGFESRPPSTFTDTSNYEDQGKLTETGLIINKFLKNVKEIAVKKIEEKKILTKEKIHEYIEGFAKLERADKLYQYCISFDEEYFKSKESRAKSIFDIFRDNYITVLDSALSSCSPDNSDSYEYKNDKLYIKDINVIKKIAENARMPDRESSPEWTHPRAKAGANKRRISNKLTNKNVRPLSKEEELKALLHMFNFYNYILDRVHTNFTLEDGKIVSLLDGHVNTTEYLEEVRSYIIENHYNDATALKRIYNLERFPFAFPSDFQCDKDGKIIIAHNIDGAILNLKVHLIREFMIQVEEKVAKKLEKMGVTEDYERMKESAYLGGKSKDPAVWYVFFDSKYFQERSELFEKFKSTYVEVFKSRWKKCGLDDSLVYCNDGVLYITNNIDVNFVEKIEEYEKKAYEKLQKSPNPHEKISLIRFPPEGIEGESPIILDEKGQYVLDHPFWSSEDMDYEESLPGFDRGNTRRKSQKRKSEDEVSTANKSLKNESSSSSEEEVCSPRSNFSDYESELCMSFHGANLGRK